MVNCLLLANLTRRQQFFNAQNIRVKYDLASETPASKLPMDSVVEAAPVRLTQASTIAEPLSYKDILEPQISAYHRSGASFSSYEGETVQMPDIPRSAFQQGFFSVLTASHCCRRSSSCHAQDGSKSRCISPSGIDGRHL